MSPLREQIELMREFMQGNSYPGPEPGSTWSASTAYPAALKTDLFGDADADEAEKRKYKDKSADKRAALRKLALWVQQKGKPSQHRRFRPRRREQLPPR